LEQAAECANEVNALLGYEMSNKMLTERLDELLRAIKRDLKAHLFLHLPAERKGWLQRPLNGWEKIIERFSNVKVDVEESSKCYACDRFAASVFHILLVAEFGVIQVAKLLHVEGDRPGWGCLDRLERILKKEYKDRSPLEQGHSEFLSRVLPFSHSMKDSWRHKISHIDNKLIWVDTVFNPELAKDIIQQFAGLCELWLLNFQPAKA
jgi:hypothetical protein